jgi:uncharacterized membrane protein AbrB (regulator of aidB expression)
LVYTFYDRSYEEVLYHQDLFFQTLQAFEFLSYATFNLAHWLFAFSYFVLSFRIEMTTKDLPEDTHKFRLVAVNTIVCLFNVAVPALVWIYSVKEKEKAEDIIFQVE